MRARSADFTSAIRNRCEQSWHETTLGTVLGEIAGRNGLSLRCAADLAAIAIGTLAQASESDVALIRRLGREHDAAATIKAGALIFSRIASGKAPSGADLPTLQLRRQDGDQHSFRIEKREEVTGISPARGGGGERSCGSPASVADPISRARPRGYLPGAAHDRVRVQRQHRCNWLAGPGSEAYPPRRFRNANFTYTSIVFEKSIARSVLRCSPSVRHHNLRTIPRFVLSSESTYYRERTEYN